MIVRRLALLGLAAPIACASKPAPASRLANAASTTGAASATAVCAAGPRVHARPDGDDLELRADPAAVTPDEVAIVDWRADLDGDGRRDLGLTFMGTTGSKGESISGVFVACGGDELVAVWGPDYIFAIEPAPGAATPAAGQWRDLVSTTRAEQADRQQLDRAEQRALRFENGRYREVP